MIDPCPTWNVQCSALSIRTHPSKSPTLRRPWKLTHMIDPRHTWNVQYNARGNGSHPPTSPNIVPEMTLQDNRQIFQKRVKRRFHCGADPSMIREWSEHEPVTLQPAAQPRLLCALAASILSRKIQHFALRLSFQISPKTAPATKTECATWVQLHQIAHLQWKVTVELHQILHLPQKLNVQLECNFINIAPARKSVLFFYSTILALYHSLTLLLFFYSNILLLYYSFALLSFDSTILWLYYSFTLLFLWLYESLNPLFFDSTILLLYYALTLLFFDSTK